jgi:hypothetical protein
VMKLNRGEWTESIAYPACVFCEATDSEPSKEDVLPRWIARLFAGHRKARFVSRVGRLGDPSWSGLQFETVGHFGRQTYGPCRRCNNGWLSALEAAAKPVLMPLFRGESHTIEPAALAVLAQWTVKTVLLYEYMRYEEQARYFTPENRRALFASRAIPPRTVVFAARYAGEDGTYGIGGQLPDLFPGAMPRSEAHCSSFAIKQLALQVFSFRPPKNYVGGRVSVSIPLDAWAEAR